MADSTSSPTPLLFYAFVRCDDPHYLEMWAQQIADTMEKAIDAACEASNGRVSRADKDEDV